LLEPLDSQDRTLGLSLSPAYLVTPSPQPVPRAARSRKAGSFFRTFRTWPAWLTMCAFWGKSGKHMLASSLFSFSPI
jgi:hypothetical protein